MSEVRRRPPRDGLFRGVSPIRFLTADELRSGGPSGGEVMTGHFAVFNQWTEINSMWEGRFLERFVPGSFKKTIRESRDSMRVLFQHGRDGYVGDKPLGAIETLAEDEQGAAYDVSLFTDASYVRDLLPALRAGQFGASFRFGVVREDWVNEPKRSDYNPDGLPERTVREAYVSEFGPVTFPAYAGASAGLRSLSDDMLVKLYARDPEKVRELLGLTPDGALDEVLADEAAECEGDGMSDPADPADATDPADGAAAAGDSTGAPSDDAGRDAHLDGTPREGALRPLVVIRNPSRHRKVVAL